MIKYQIKEQILQYLGEINMSVNALEKLCGFSSRYLAKSSFELPKKKIDQILAVLPNLNPEWLLTGNGNMRLGGEDIVKDDAKSSFIRRDNPDFDAKKREEIMSRLLTIIQKEGFPTVSEFEKEIGVWRGTWNNALKRGTQRIIFGWVDGVISKFPGYSYDWAIYGTGPMKRQEGQAAPQKIDIDNSINFLGQYRIPGFPSAEDLYLSPCDSLDKTIHKGDILICRRINLDKPSPLNLSKPYLIILDQDEDDIFVSKVKQSEKTIQIIDADGQQMYSLTWSDMVYMGQILGKICTL